MNTSTTGSLAPTGSRIVVVLEQAWTAIRLRHRHVPPVVVITGAGRAPRGYATLGHFGADRWQHPDGREAELFIAGELLAGLNGHSGGRAVMCTLLHEAAHGIAHERGIKDCSRQNRYHNTRFAALARELGLTPPETPHPTLGYSDAALGEQTAATWREVIENIDAARLPHLGTLLTAEPRPAANTRAGGRFTVTCGCEPARKLSITPRQHDTAPLICGACKAAFEPAR